MNDVKVNHRTVTRSAAAALITAVVALIPAGAADAQSIMRSPNLNISSRTPTITARINPNVAGRTTANTATIAGRGANVATTTGNIAGRGTVTQLPISRIRRSAGQRRTSVRPPWAGQTDPPNVSTTAAPRDDRTGD